MTWDELKEEAKKMGLIVYSDIIVQNGVCFWDNGEVVFNDETLASKRTPDQMLAIIKALRQEVGYEA